MNARLDRAIRLVCPIHGVSVGSPDDKTTWRIDFKEEATAEQQAAAANVLAGFTELDAARELRWQAIRAARDAERDAGFLFNAKRIQSDPTSRQNIAGAAQAASIAKAAGQPFAVEWTCADNSVIELNADQVIAMFLTGAQAVQAIYARGVELRTQLAAAASVEEIESVAW